MRPKIWVGLCFGTSPYRRLYFLVLPISFPSFKSFRESRILIGSKFKRIFFIFLYIFPNSAVITTVCIFPMGLTYAFFPFFVEAYSLASRAQNNIQLVAQNNILSLHTSICSAKDSGATTTMLPNNFHKDLCGHILTMLNIHCRTLILNGAVHDFLSHVPHLLPTASSWASTKIASINKNSLYSITFHLCVQICHQYNALSYVAYWRVQIFHHFFFTKRGLSSWCSELMLVFSI